MPAYNSSKKLTTKVSAMLWRVWNYLLSQSTKKWLPFIKRILVPYWNKYVNPFYQDKFIPYANKELLPKWENYIKPYMQIIDNKINEFVLLGFVYFDNWNNTKRALFLIVSNLVLLLIGVIFYILPEYNNLKLNQAKINSINRSLASLNREEKTFLADISDNPNKSIQENIGTIKEKIQQQVGEIEQFTKKQLETPRMVQIIKSKVSQNESLKLFRVASLSTYRITPLTLGATKIGLDKLPEILVHPIELDINGDYINTYKFLTTLEDSWRIFWDSVEYLVDNYPSAKISIRVHLLVLSKVFDE